MSARSGLVGKNHPGPIWGHLGPFFAWAEKIEKNAEILSIFLGGPMGPIHPLWGTLAVDHHLPALLRESCSEGAE